MENPEKSHTEEIVKVIDGITQKKVDTGYSVRQFFSHTTLEKGPGPGWDRRLEILKQYEVHDSADLPDEPYYIWEQADE